MRKCAIFEEEQEEQEEEEEEQEEQEEEEEEQEEEEQEKDRLLCLGEAKERKRYFCVHFLCVSVSQSLLCL